MAEPLQTKKLSELPLVAEVADTDVVIGEQNLAACRIPLSLLAGTQSKFSQLVAYPAGSVGARLKAQISISDAPYSALAGADSTAQFQAAYDAAPAGGTILVPGPGPYSITALTGTKNVTWEVLFDINTNVGLLNLPGRITGGFAAGGILRQTKSLGSDYATSRIDRVANYSGGSSSQVCSALRVTSDVTNNAAASYEWGITSVMNNSGRGENVSIYGQANRRAGSAVTIGGTFGAVFEARDYTAEVSPTTGLVSCEADMIANGPDANGRRVVHDVVIGKQDAAGSTCEAFAAFRVSPQGNVLTAGRFRYGFHMVCDKDYGIYMAGPTVENVIDLAPTSSKIGVKIGGASSDAGFVHDGTAPYGMRFSGTYANAAIRMAEGVGIAYESTGAIQMKYNAGFMELRNTGVLRTSFSTSTGAMKVGANQVVGVRDTGWAAMTGTGNKATVYDVSSVTLPQLAARMASLQAALTTHGLIGA